MASEYDKTPWKKRFTLIGKWALSPELMKLLQERAMQENRSQGSIVRQALTEFLQSQQQ